MANDDDDTGAAKATGGSSATTKAIARAAVEAEFRKKKKRKRGGGYGSSSSEEENGDDTDDRRRKQGRKGDDKNKRGGNTKTNDELEDEEERKAVEEDLAKRYRDRAAERREGKMGDQQVGETKPASIAATTTGATAAAYPLIVPHNKKGLDLILARKARKSLQKESTDQNDDGTTGDDSPLTLAGLHVLKEFVEAPPGQSSTAPDTNNIHRNRGVMNYLRIIVKHADQEGLLDEDNNSTNNNNNNNLPPSNKKISLTRIYDAVELGAAGRTLQQTHFVMALDGHPSDVRRAWQIPRQEIQSALANSRSASTSNRGAVAGDGAVGSSFFDNGAGGGGMTLVPSDVLVKVDQIFQKRNRILEDMKRTATLTAVKETNSKKSMKKMRHRQEQNEESIQENAAHQEEQSNEDDDDFDIFGGVGDYVPPSAPQS